MASGIFSIRLERPPTAVFPFVSNLERAPEWVPDLVSVTKQTPGDVGVGTRYSEVVRMGNNTGTGTLEIMEYEAPHSFMHKGESGPARFVARITLEPDGDGTLLTHEYTVRMKGLFRFLDPLIGGWVRRNTETSLKNLRRIIDA
jgi:carbon monoxide dehydrogenase subunit G